MAITLLGAISGAKPRILENGVELVLEKTFPANQRWEESEVEHLHPHQDEHYEILEGILSARMAGRERTFVSAETIRIPQGVPHRICNLSRKPVRTIWKVAPARSTAAYIETIHAFRSEGKMDSLLRQAVVAWEYRDIIKPLCPPLWVQPFSIAPLALIGRLLGYKTNRHC